jgi:hypothetical protein
MQRLSATDFATRLGGKPEDWGLKPQWTVSVDENMRVTVDDLGGQALGHVTVQERAMLEQRVDKTLRMTGQELARRLGASARSFGLSPHEAVVIDEKDRVIADGRLIGSLHPADREILEAPARALATINRYRRSTAGSTPPQPGGLRMSAEAYRIGSRTRLRGEALAAFLSTGSALGRAKASVLSMATPRRPTA